MSLQYLCLCRENDPWQRVGILRTMSFKTQYKKRYQFKRCKCCLSLLLAIQKDYWFILLRERETCTKVPTGQRFHHLEWSLLRHSPQPSPSHPLFLDVIQPFCFLDSLTIHITTFLTHSIRTMPINLHHGAALEPNNLFSPEWLHRWADSLTNKTLRCGVQPWKNVLMQELFLHQSFFLVLVLASAAFSNINTKNHAVCHILLSVVFKVTDAHASFGCVRAKMFLCLDCNFVCSWGW